MGSDEKWKKSTCEGSKIKCIEIKRVSVEGEQYIAEENAGYFLA